jgi:hypothetical protein
MVRSESQDYFVYEPALAMVHNRPIAVMPTRFFMRDGKFYAKACHLLGGKHSDSWVIDGYSPMFEIALDDFRFSLPWFEASHKDYGIPSPHKIYGQ